MPGRDSTKNQSMAKHLVESGWWHGRRPSSPYPNSGGTPPLNVSGSSKAQRRSKGTYSSSGVVTSPRTPKAVRIAPVPSERAFLGSFTGDAYDEAYNVTTRYVNGVPVTAFRPHQSWDYSEAELEKRDKEAAA